MKDALLERRAFHESGHVVAAITFSAPIISVTIDDTPHFHRGHWKPPPDIGLESISVICLLGPASEECFCGPITDGTDATGYEMARRHLATQFNPMEIGAELERLRNAARRLVPRPWAKQRIRVLVDALLRKGTLSAEEIAIGLLTRSMPSCVQS